MKLISATILLLTLLMFSCGQNGKAPVTDESNASSDANESSELNLDDPDTLARIVASAVDQSVLNPPSKSEVCFYPEKTPFTGWMKANWPDGKLLRLVQYKNGKQDGPSVSWHENGEKNYWSKNENGIEQGTRLRYYSTGKIASRGIIKDGVAGGPYESWHANGQKKWVGQHNIGKKEGLWLSTTMTGRKTFATPSRTANTSKTKVAKHSP